VLCAIKGVAFVSLLLTASVTDLRSRTIPYTVCALIALTGLIGFSPVRLWGLLLAVPFFIASGFDKGGAGDFFLIAASCFVLGLPRGAFGLTLGLLCFCLFYLAVAAVRTRRGKKEKPVSHPLAPFLAVGFTAAYFI
jgi:leader peptidase (prepilin peptidase)/N-methyltransferase